MIIENHDILNFESDENICKISSDMDIKMSELNTTLKRLTTDTKKLKKNINEIKLLKRKRELKLSKKEEKQEHNHAYEVDNFFDFWYIN